MQAVGRKPPDSTIIIIANPCLSPLILAIRFSIPFERANLRILRFRVVCSSVHRPPHRQLSATATSLRLLINPEVD